VKGMDRALRKQIKELQIGDYVRVAWWDANDARGPLEKHNQPECLVDEWGVFLGVEGKLKHILLGKHYVREDRAWEATRIPLMLLDSVELIAKRASRSMFPRRYRIASRRNVLVVRDLG